MDRHISDQQLLLDVEGQLGSRDASDLRAHLRECWRCRTRRQEIEASIADFVRARRVAEGEENLAGQGPRAMLRARIAEFSAAEPDRWIFPTRLACSVGFFVLLMLGAMWLRPGERRVVVAVSRPDAVLTPGATLLASRAAVCAQENVKNKTVPVLLQRQVFAEYGISGADPRAYEVDYLITPALGGADDIHNLWPHSYGSTVWNAQVKDALEDRLREMVCDGTLDLSEAQHAIAGDWIAAYKKYFHTDRPLTGAE